MRKPRNIEQAEWIRLQELLHYEREALAKGFKRIAGIDEAGRGPLAGPVVAAACIIPENIVIPGVDDSKKLTPLIRQNLYDAITSIPEISYAIAIVDAATIDIINIYQATLKAMLDAVNKLTIPPDFLLVDGTALPNLTIPSEKIIKGDSKSHSIAAASILAKVTRDRLMEEYHIQWPDYGFNQHKGYGTEKHIDAIAKYGACPIHRMTFAPLKKL